ncbi:MAG: alpha/beta fold hydrolase [bacterium]|nr:alpha/beta fold hydrolase [bacterium]
MMLYTLLFIMALGVAAFFALRQFERMNVWVPRRDLIADPSQIGLEYEIVTLHAADGATLSAWYLPHPEARASLLFCHGNAGNISYRLEALRQFHSLALNVFIFDYRGYGVSRGRLSEKGTYLDAAAAYEWLKGKTPGLPLVVFGRSLGAATAVDVASAQRPDALIFESGFTSIPGLGREIYPMLPVKWVSAIHYDNLAKISRVRAPMLVIHSPDDELIPFHHGREIFAAANPPKEFLEIAGLHNEGFLLSEDRYLEGIDRFLDQYVAANPAQSESDSDPTPSREEE